MKRYIIKRIFMMIPVLFGITIMSFIIMHLTPGSPVDSVTMSPDVDMRAQQRLYSAYGLDQPLHRQYFSWLGRVATLNFGRSFRDSRPVLEKIAERLPATILLNVCSLFLIFMIAIPVGIISAVEHNRFIDRLFTVIVFIGYSIPTFALALVMMYVFGVKLSWLPVSGMTSVNYEYMTSFWLRFADVAKHMVLPVLTSAIGGLAFISRYMRSSMLEIIRQDFIKAARARGVSEMRIILVHAFRNALIPIVTMLGLLLPVMMSGSVIFETIFSWPGMGRLAYNAIMSRDYPVIMGVGVIMAVLTLAGNFLADIGYAAVDPRIRYRK